MSLTEDDQKQNIRAEVRTLLTKSGFTSGQANQLLEGMNVIEELSQELGDLSAEAVRELNLVSSPFMGMLLFVVDQDDPQAEMYFSLVKDLLSEVVRAAYQLGIKVWQEREENKDLPN